MERARDRPDRFAWHFGFHGKLLGRHKTANNRNRYTVVSYVGKNNIGRNTKGRLCVGTVKNNLYLSPVTNFRGGYQKLQVHFNRTPPFIPIKHDIEQIRVAIKM